MKHKLIQPLKKIYRIARKGMLVILCRIEQRGRSSLKKELPMVSPIFIIGAPRSGSTLLLQCMTEAFDLAYMTNLHHQLYTNPSFVERLVKPFRRSYQGDFKSKHGRTKGWLGPSEAGNYWYRFFRKKPQHVGLKDVDPQKMKEMQYSIFKIEQAAQRPVLYKNLPISVRLAPIMKYFPKAVFIIIRRDIISNTNSILNARYKALQKYDEWWSVEPPCKPDFENAAPHIQVIEQIRGIYSEIDKARTGEASSKFHDISYSNLCQKPQQVMQEIKKHLNENNVVTPWNIDVLPRQFTEVERDKDTHPFANDIKNYLGQK